MYATLPREVVVELKVKKLHPDAVLPTRADPGSSGWDLYAADNYCINPGQTVLVDTGLTM